MNNTNSLLADTIKEAKEAYMADKEKEFSKECKSWKIFTEEIPNQIKCKLDLYKEKYEVKGSIGKGGFSDVPWVGIFNKNITTSAQNGIYLVQLYAYDGRGMFFGIVQGMGNICKALGDKKGKEISKNVSEMLRKQIGNVSERYNDYIDLKAKENGKKKYGRLKRYEAGYVIGTYYDFDNMPYDQVLNEDIDSLLELYDRVCDLLPKGYSFEEYALQLYSDEISEKNEKDVRKDYYEKSPDFTLIAEEKNKQINKKNSNAKEEKSVYNNLDYYRKKKLPIKGRHDILSYPRDEKLIRSVLKREKYRCENDNNHKSFDWEQHPGKNYVEGHHLIPISRFNDFNVSLDVPANIICLCPVCHKCLHHGTPKEKKKILIKLYKLRKDCLISSGLNIEENKLLEYYGIK